MRQVFIDETRSIVSTRGGRVEFVEMSCEESALEKRLDTPERRVHHKINSVTWYSELRDRGVFASPKMPTPQMRVDTTRQSPREAAVQILEALGLPLSGEPAA